MPPKIRKRKRKRKPQRVYNTVHPDKMFTDEEAGWLQDERQKIREVLAPATICGSCETPHCCSFQVNTLPSEAALIIKQQPDVVEACKDKLVQEAYAHNQPGTCSFLGEEGRCLVYEVSPWACVYYTMTPLESPDDCKHRVEVPNSKDMSFGPLALPVHQANSEEFERDRSKLVGINDVRPIPIAAAVVQIMCLHNPEWVEAWKAVLRQPRK